MISIKQNTVHVKFGESNKATIAIFGSHGTITLQELVKEKSIGEQIENEDANELPKVELEFSQLESIDALINGLKTIRKNWVDPDSYAAAC